MTERTTTVQGLSLRELLPGAQFVGASDIRVSGCAGDSRQCRPGDLFAALPGESADGHDFVDDAQNRGAKAVLAGRPIAGCALPLCLVRDPHAAYAQICQALVGDPSRQLKVVGVTGTNGKTTSSFLAAAVLHTAGYQPGVLGTLGYCDCVQIEDAPWTTPPAPVLASWLARMLANGCSHAVMEVSSHALVQSRVQGVKFDVACVTNIRHDHLDYHGNWPSYLAAKARLLDHLAPRGLTVVNVDDRYGAGMLAQTGGRVTTIAVDLPADVTATVLETFSSEQIFLLSAGKLAIAVRTCLIGKHNIYNCLIATAVGLAYDIDLEVIVRGLESVRTVPGRLERLECGQPFAVFVDYAHTPDALTNCLKTLRDTTAGKLICVFGAGGDRDQSKRPRMGRAVEAGADVAVVTNDNPRSEDPDDIFRDILSGFHHPADARVIADRAEAIGWALGEAHPGDCVLIAGKGHEDYQIIGQRRLHCDDRELARQWLYESPSVDAMLRSPV